LAQTVHNSLWTVQKKNVRNLEYRPIILDGFKLSRKNSLDLFPDGFFPDKTVQKSHFFCSGM
jgi:hypothetical protein